MYNGHLFSYGWLLACWPSRRVICIACRFHKIFSFPTAPSHCEVFYWLVQCDWALVVAACRVPMDIFSCMPELFPSSTQYLIPWIDTHHQHLNQHLDRSLVELYGHLIDQQSIDSWPSVNLIMNQLKISGMSTDCLTDCWARCSWSVNQVSTKVLMESQLSIDGMLKRLIKGTSINESANRHSTFVLNCDNSMIYKQGPLTLWVSAKSTFTHTLKDFREQEQLLTKDLKQSVSFLPHIQEPKLSL